MGGLCIERRSLLELCSTSQRPSLRSRRNSSSFITNPTMAPPFDNEEVKAPLFNDEEVNYIVSLKSFYSDIDFTSLTQTFNFWYDHCIEPIVIEWFCRAFIGTSRVPVDTPPKLWIKGNLQHGGLNSQLRTLARFRIMHDLVHAMQEDSIP